MAVGKSSLGRVANAGKGVAAKETTATVVVPEKKAEAKKAPEVKKAAETKKTTACANKIYAVGDALPVYLL